MVCKVQQGNSLFKYKEMVCLSTSRRSFVKSQPEDGL